MKAPEKSRVKAPLQWWEDWSFLAPDARADFGSLISQIDRGLMTQATPTLSDNPAGWDGITRRGPWDRLVPDQWALAEAAPEEFVRRADEGELSFWQRAQESKEGSRSVWVWLDAGPEQLGACRVVQIALLLWLQRACLASGGQFFWGIIQYPERGYDKLAGDELRVFLAARTVDPPRRPPERLDNVQTWCVGGPNWMSQVPSGISRVLLTESAPGCVELRAFGRLLTLNLPSSKRAIRLLRDPLVWDLPTAGSMDIPHARWRILGFASNGHRALLGDDQRVMLLPIPSSAIEPPGPPKTYQLPWNGRLIACSVDQKAVRIVQAQGKEWVFSLLNAGQESYKDWARVPRPNIADSSPGACWKYNGQWHLWIDDTLYRCESGELKVISYVRGGCSLGRSSVLISDKGDIMDASGKVIRSIGRISPIRVCATRSYRDQANIAGYLVAYQINADWWRFDLGADSSDIKVDGTVIGLHSDVELGPLLIVNNNGWLRLQGPNSNEALDLGLQVAQCAVHPNGILAFASENYQVGCYNLHQRNRLWLVQP